MVRDRIQIDRRSFIKGAAPFALGLHAIVRPQVPLERGRFNEDDVRLAREQLLRMVNEERSQAGLNKLELDDLACNVAREHALDMAKGEFLSHWGTDGRKPYHRYSFAGANDAVEENDGAVDHGAPVASDEAAGDLISLHSSMFYESPPNDGHRKTILNESHTHVGFGIATRDTHVR